MALTTGILVALGLINPIEDPGYESGLTLRVWDVARPIEFLAEIGPDQTPNVDCKVDEVNFQTIAEFFGADGVPSRLIFFRQTRDIQTDDGELIEAAGGP